MSFTGRYVVAILALTAACGRDATTVATAPAGTEPSGTVAEALTINLNQLPNYATPAWPAHYDAATLAQDNAPATNAITDRGATLGRVLFHDRRLSVNNAISCASCHRVGAGFSDAARFSTGFNGVDRTTAHSMRLANARFYAPGTAFWDRRAASLEAQATQPIRHAVEMGFTAAHGGLDALLTRMRALPYYTELFTLAFGDASITEDRLQRAIAQYVRSIVSLDSRFDRGYAQVYSPQLREGGINTPFATFTAQENRGKQLYLQPPRQGGAGCAICHTPPSFALTANSRSNGLDAGEVKLFKAPSLKNAAVAGPYMHDGRFNSLEQVVDHYDHGVQNGPALDNRLRGPAGQGQRLQLAANDKAALVAFLRTLTDSSLAADVRYSDPFRR